MTCCVQRSPRVIQNIHPVEPVDPVFGQMFIGTFDLQPFASGVWADTPLEVNLPEAGTYELVADVTGGYGAVSPTAVAIEVRLFNVTTASEIPDGRRRLMFANITAPAGVTYAFHDSVGIHNYVTVTGPDTIRLQATRIVAGGDSNSAALVVQNRLAFMKVA